MNDSPQQDTVCVQPTFTRQTMELQDRILEDLGKTLGVNLTFDEHNQCLI